MGKGEERKRLVITIEVLNAKEIFSAEVKKRLGIAYYLCCGVWTVGNANKYCACCCLCFTERELTEQIGMQVMYTRIEKNKLWSLPTSNYVSKKLTENNLANELCMVGDNKFQLLVRKVSNMKQMAMKTLLKNKIDKALAERGIKFLLKVERMQTMAHKDTDELKEDNKTTSTVSESSSFDTRSSKINSVASTRTTMTSKDTLASNKRPELTPLKQDEES
ncbi:hypothetical protein RFI_23937 [Reticulomyxa filosa]|uniref:Uncharacterized protein n=1 Tax=Reticulomyxa filosa TaxID=46433 RepID=X6MJ39_RETFI|nr:hypothetical protein RFI_23937 [Reticulomyxa filosa]|eukprot:ETO13437.1 hypothetical protein RFI_23937 [Reticulomyxa filosa]